MLRKVMLPFSQFGWVIVFGIILTLRQQIPLWFEIILIVASVISIVATTVNIVAKTRRARGE